MAPLTDLGSAPLRPLLLGATGTLQKLRLQGPSPLRGSLQERVQRSMPGERLPALTAACPPSLRLLPPLRTPPSSDGSPALFPAH